MRSLLAFLCCLGGAAFAEPIAISEIPRTLPEEALPDPNDIVTWPVKAYPEYAKDSIVNLGNWLLDAPAGKHGFVKPTPQGRLQFEDGTPARFWGTTTVFALTFPDKPEEIEKLADAIAARGYNLVRFHHNDMHKVGMGFLREKPKSNYLLDPVGMDRLDRFAAELFKRGIYVYLDIVDYRPLLEEDGLENWEELSKIGGQGWKGLFPHPQIVAAWKRSVTELLKHKNPYTGRTWDEEPGVTTIEIINENGLFWDWNFKLNENMLKWHDQQWNKWLLTKYGSREKLDAQWTDISGAKGLFPDEDPAKGTVFAPRHASVLEWDRPYRSKTRGAARLNDWYAHLADRSIAFYKDASQTIRGLGFKGIIVGSHELQGPLNQYSEVTGTGTIAAHLYANGMTAWNARPGTKGVVVEGVDVKSNNWFSNLPRVKVRGVPGINGEWTGGTLTRRADVNLAVAAITGFQGVTQSLHFSFGHRWGGEPMPNYDIAYKYAHYKNAISFTFSNLHDIPWMTVNRIAAPLFIRGDFARAKAKVHLAYSREDLLEQNLHALGRGGGSGTIGDAALFLPILHEVECAFFDKVYDGDADVVFMTGRSSSGDYRKARHAVLVGDNPYGDPYHKTRDLGVIARTIHPGVKIANLEEKAVFTLGAPWEKERILAFDKLEGAVELTSIPPGATPIGKSADGKYTMGWLDDRFLVLPNGRAFADKIGDRQWLYRLYLTSAKRWGIDTAGNVADGTFYQSDTRELTIDWAHGTTVVDTLRTQGFSGLPGWRPSNETRNLRAEIDGAYGNVLVTSTDGKPIGESRRMLLVATGTMQNTEQVIGLDKDGKTSFVKTGKAPLLVEALRGNISLGSKLASDLEVYALDPSGRRLGKVETSAKDGRLEFALSPRWATVWFEVCTRGTPGAELPPGTLVDWPRTETSRTAQLAKPAMIAVNSFFELVNKPRAEEGRSDESSAAAAAQVVLRDFDQQKQFGKHSNILAKLEPDAEKGQVLKAQFGKVDKSWAGGFFFAIEKPVGVKPEDCLGLKFDFKGDGTLPREAYLTLRAGEAGWRSKNLNKLFEDDSWKEILLSPGDFQLDPAFAKKNPEKAAALPPMPDWASLDRIDFVVIGPLMDQMSVGGFADFALLTKSGAAASNRQGAVFRSALPKPGTPSSAKIEIPYFADASIATDGKADEESWKNAMGLTMDEESLPEWHFFGSHVVTGKRENGEGANFWLFATRTGLAVLAEVKKGTPEIVAESKEWYENDCVEIFTDPSNQGEKPAKQLFLGYRTAGADRPGSSAEEIGIGRTKLEDGYVLEALIPWKTLGFEKMPGGEFGLEFQVDFARRGGGRVLQMTYGTGTNEAWIKADRYLKARLK